MSMKNFNRESNPQTFSLYHSASVNWATACFQNWQRQDALEFKCYGKMYTEICKVENVNSKWALKAARRWGITSRISRLCTGRLWVLLRLCIWPSSENIGALTSWTEILDTRIMRRLNQEHLIYTLMVCHWYISSLLSLGQSTPF